MESEFTSKSIKKYSLCPYEIHSLDNKTGVCWKKTGTKIPTLSIMWQFLNGATTWEFAALRSTPETNN